jgi:hypothetical protein
MGSSITFQRLQGIFNTPRGKKEIWVSPENISRMGRSRENRMYPLTRRASKISFICLCGLCLALSGSLTKLSAITALVGCVNKSAIALVRWANGHNS